MLTRFDGRCFPVQDLFSNDVDVVERPKPRGRIERGLDIPSIVIHEVASPRIYGGLLEQVFVGKVKRQRDIDVAMT